MRIISGQARRIALATPAGLAVRPTADRVKEALFSMLGPLPGLRVADLCAGTGALGLEALSRGAAFVLLAEQHPRHVECLRRNLAAVTHAMGLETAGDRVQVAPYDVRLLPVRAAGLAGTLDLVLADPPYRPERDQTGPADLLRDAALAAWAGPAALLVLEHEAGEELPWHPAGPWRLQRQRRFGRTVLSFARPAAPD